MIQQLDPRIKLWGILPVIIGIHFIYTPQIELVFMAILLSTLYLLGFPKIALRLFFIYALQWAIFLFILPYIEQPFFLFTLSSFSIGVRRLMPAVVSLFVVFRTTPMSQWLTLFYQWNIPSVLSLPIIVMGRFFPTLRQDIRLIREAMALRGIANHWRDWFKQPLVTFEYLLIPILMKATQLGDDLSLSAITKGFSLDGDKTIFQPLKMTIRDYVYGGIITSPILIQIGGALIA